MPLRPDRPRRRDPTRPDAGQNVSYLVECSDGGASRRVPFAQPVPAVSALPVARCLASAPANGQFGRRRRHGRRGPRASGHAASGGPCRLRLTGGGRIGQCGPGASRIRADCEPHRPWARHVARRRPEPGGGRADGHLAAERRAGQRARHLGALPKLHARGCASQGAAAAACDLSRGSSEPHTALRAPRAPGAGRRRRVAKSSAQTGGELGRHRRASARADGARE